LSAARNVQQDISFYVFQTGGTEDPDIEVPKKLAERVGLDFEVIRPVELTDEFLASYRREHVIPRILPKTRHIQYHFRKYPNGQVTNINGNCNEIVRCTFGQSSRRITTKMLCTFAGYRLTNQFIQRAIQQWFLGAREFSKEYDIALNDLFYWEQRLGQWGSLYPQEQDIAIDEFSPFNNRNLLLSVLRVPAKERASPNYSFFRKLIRHSWPELLAERINPFGLTGHIKTVMKRYGVTRYYATMLRHRARRV
jgi:hypothetical protein